MLLFIVIIFTWFIAAISYNIYSIFSPYYETLKDIKDYNIAYYWAIASIERAQLVLKFRKAWFEWSGWWIWNTNFWPNSDQKIENLWFLSKQNNWTYRQIKSRVSSIPEPWKWNIEQQLQYTWDNYWWNSKDFNKLEYNLPAQFALFLDNCSDNNSFYKQSCWTLQNISDTINIILRLPPKIKNNLWDLNETEDIDWDWISNDVIVNRSLFGSGNGQEYSIFPTISVDYDNNSVNNDDSAIREDIINKVDTILWFPNIIFWNNKNPVRNTNPSYHNIIPPDHPFSWKNFTDIFSNSENTYLKLSIVNLMQTSDWNIYPFLEYKLYPSTTSTTLSDRFFTIKWVWIVWNYKVEIIIKKPILKSSTASDFAIIF